MATERDSPDEVRRVEDEARRLHRLDAGLGGVGVFRSWESLTDATKEMYRAQARVSRRNRR